MPGWVLPALKAVLPHVGTIVAAAKPVFSRRSAGDKPPLEEQIAELQGAITQNADHIKALAEQLRQTVTVLEQEAETTRDKLKRAYWVSGAAVVVAVASAVIAFIALMR